MKNLFVRLVGRLGVRRNALGARCNALRLYGWCFVLCLVGCQYGGDSVEQQPDVLNGTVIKKEVKEVVVPQSLGEFPRNEIKERLAEKIKNKEDLFVHVFVPLCDNEHQGIVPVSKNLGDGFNPSSNLYWGALYGVKTHLKKHRDWSLTKTIKKPYDNDIILERVIFKKVSNGQNVYLVADAYRGDKMEDCLMDHANSIAGKSKDNISIDDLKINIRGNADLLFFNGHNGLMDMEIPIIENTDSIKKDAVAIACASHGFFTQHLPYSGGYPLLMTTNLLAPEAYVLEAIVSEWAKGSDGKIVADAAGRAYNQYQKCGYKGARRLFKSGW